MLFLVLLLLAPLLGCTAGSREEDLSGQWAGHLTYPGLELPVGIRLLQQPDRTYAAVLIRPDQGDQEIPADEVAFTNGQLRIVIASIGATYIGRLDPERASLLGRWEQGGFTQPLVLRRGLEFAQPARPQTPHPPFPYEGVEVTFPSRAEGITLAGTLTRPAGGESFPAALLVSGVGAHDRDCVILGHRWFLVLADYLTRRGIAVLRFDDRGVGGSSGDRSSATTADYAEDALGGVDFLIQQTTIDPQRTGIIGHSEGGTIAALAAAGEPQIAFLVMLAAPGLPGGDYNLQFEASLGRALGESEETIAAKQDLQRRVLAILAQPVDSAAMRGQLRSLLEALEPPLPAARIEGALRRFLSPWFRYNARHDPGATLRQVGCPVLAVIGGKDIQVPAGENLAALEAALRAGGNRNVQVEQIPGLNHFFQSAETGSPEEYGRIEETFSPDALERIADWILRQPPGK